jgi:branched-subunit amino acid transport protein
VTTWVIIFAIGLGTYSLRLCMLVVLAGRSLPPRARSAVGLVAPAALSALVSTMLIENAGRAGPAETAAVLAGFVAVRRTHNVVHAFVVGLPVFAVVAVVL